MAFQQGDTYLCPDSEFGSEIQVTRSPAPKEGRISQRALLQREADAEV
ncbi:MAG: hypothetical protein IT180_02925 [Acidobacteria bacterium]|nr:hypothetical protein [Acidobacteriota bacterium]